MPLGLKNSIRMEVIPFQNAMGGRSRGGRSNGDSFPAGAGPQVEATCQALATCQAVWMYEKAGGV